MRYDVWVSETSPWGNHAVVPFGRWAIRTSTHPGCAAITGSADG